MIPTGIITGGIGLLAGGIEALIAHGQQKKLQGQLNALQRPVWEASPYENQMLAQAESQAGQGMSAGSKQAYLSQAQQGLGTSIDALEKGGGSANAIGSLYGNYDKSLANLSIYDDQARQRNIQNLMGSYQRQSALADKSFMFNKYAPYVDQKTALTQQLQGATNMFQSGLNTAIGGLTGGLQAWGNQSNTNSVLGNIQQGGAQQGAGGAGDIGAQALMGMPASDNTGGGGYGGYGNFSGSDASYTPYSMRQMPSKYQQNTWGVVPEL